MVTLRVKENSKQAKAFIELVKTFDFVDFVEPKSRKLAAEKKVADKPYNPKFVSKVLNSYNSDKRKTIETANLWENI